MDAPPSGPADPWRLSAHRFAAEHLRPIAARVDRDDRLPDGTVEALARAGFLSLGTPELWGGRGGDARSIAGVLEELSWGCAAVGVLVAVHLSVASAPVLAWGTTEQKERYLRPLATGAQLGAFGLTEPGVGSDAASLRTRYERVGDGFVVHGRKMFISNAARAGFLLAFATSDPALGRHGISAFVVPTSAPGFSVNQRLDKLGLRGSDTTELVLDAVRLGPDALLGPEGAGLKVALSSLAGGRIGIAACALGVARAAFEELVGAVRRDDAEWKHGMLARAYADLASARALVDRAAARKDAGAPFAREASVAKLVASKAAVAIAHAAIDVAGADGLRAEAAAGRLLRDARVFPIVEGTTEIQERVLAREILTDREPNPL